MHLTSRSEKRIYIERMERDQSFFMPEYHHHPYYELYIVESGEVKAFVGSRMYELRRSTLMLIPPDELHFMRYEKKEPCRRTTVYFLQSHVGDERIWRSLWRDGASRMPLVFELLPGREAEFYAILARMRQESQQSDALSPLFMELRLRELLLMLGRTAKEIEALPGHLPAADEGILSAARFISAHFQEKLTLGSIAHEAGFSPNYLSTRFREVTGLGVHDYLIYVRLKWAAQALLDTEAKITEIALSAGFSSSNYFKDAFKNAYGLSPRAFRTQARAGGEMLSGERGGWEK